MTRSRSYQTLFFFIFWFSLLSLTVCNKWKRCIYNEMAKLNSKKRKNCAFTKKKSLVGLTPDFNWFDQNKLFNFFWNNCKIIWFLKHTAEKCLYDPHNHKKEIGAAHSMLLMAGQEIENGLRESRVLSLPLFLSFFLSFFLSLPRSFISCFYLLQW